MASLSVSPSEQSVSEPKNFIKAFKNLKSFVNDNKGKSITGEQLEKLEKLIIDLKTAASTSVNFVSHLPKRTIAQAVVEKCDKVRSSLPTLSSTENTRKKYFTVEDVANHISFFENRKDILTHKNTLESLFELLQDLVGHINRLLSDGEPSNDEYHNYSITASS